MKNSLTNMILSPSHRITLGIGQFVDLKENYSSISKGKKLSLVHKTYRPISSQDKTNFKLSLSSIGYNKHSYSKNNNKNNKTHSLFYKSQSSKYLRSVIIANKSKLSAFNTLIKEIFQPDAMNKTPLNNSSPILKSSINKYYSSNTKHFSHVTFSAKGKQKSIDYLVTGGKGGVGGVIEEEKELIRNHIGHSSSTPSKKYKINNHNCLLKDNSCSTFGSLNQYFTLFKQELNKKRTKMTNLINNVNRANAMNENWLKSYVVRLKCKQTKYFSMPKIEFDNYDIET